MGNNRLARDTLLSMRTIIVVSLIWLSAQASARIYQAPLPRDYPTRVKATVRFDAATRLYEYSYAISNPPSNPRGVECLVLALQTGTGRIADVRSPRGWRGNYLPGRQRLSWAATKVTVPEGHVDDGNVLPGDFVVAPGKTLGGFSFRSPDPPGVGLAITQTYAPLPSADDDDELAGLPYESTLPEENGFRLQLTMPVSKQTSND